MDERRGGNNHRSRTGRFRNNQKKQKKIKSEITSHSLHANSRSRGRPRNNGGNNRPAKKQPAMQPQRAYTPPPVGNGVIEPFELFCALHLNITHDDRFYQQNLNDIARRFGVSVAELKQKVLEFGMDQETINNSEFDLEMAQLDIKVAPEGISRRELARGWFEEFQKAVKPSFKAVQGAPLPTDISTPIFDEDV